MWVTKQTWKAITLSVTLCYVALRHFMSCAETLHWKRNSFDFRLTSLRVPQSLAINFTDWIIGSSRCLLFQLLFTCSLCAELLLIGLDVLFPIGMSLIGGCVEKRSLMSSLMSFQTVKSVLLGFAHTINTFILNSPQYLNIFNAYVCAYLCKIQFQYLTRLHFSSLPFFQVNFICKPIRSVMTH